MDRGVIGTVFVLSALVQEFTPVRSIDDDVNVIDAGHVSDCPLFERDDGQAPRGRVDRARKIKSRTIWGQLHALKDAEWKAVASVREWAVKERLLCARRRIIDGNPVLKLFVPAVKFVAVHEETAPNQSNLTLLGDDRTETSTQVSGMAAAVLVNDVSVLLEGPLGQNARRQCECKNGCGSADNHATHGAIPFHYTRLTGATVRCEGLGEPLIYAGLYATASISTLIPGIANAATTVVRAGLVSPKNSA